MTLCKRATLAIALLVIAAPAWAISVTLTAPANNAVFQAGSTINLTASATPTNASRPIVKVEFFRGGTTLIGTDTTSPYSFAWTNVPAGSYSLTAKATDSSGATATSKAVTIKVNAPPTVSLTAPAGGATFNSGSTITLSATAADSDGTISKVDFFQGTTLIGTDTTSPYSINWTNVAAGSYSLTARATDSNSGVTTSSAVAILVDTPPTVSITAPANNAVVLPGSAVTITASAADTDGTVSKVDFFDGATLIGTATAAPFSITVSNLAAGAHSLTARATDNLGRATTSAAVSVRVDAAPAVSITAPANGAVFPSPGSFTITATASDADGTVSKVDFFDGATLVGTATASPYSAALTGVAAGVHSYTARATDNNGAVSTSAAISVTVNTAPAVSITSPANNAVFAAPATIALSASASDSDGTISKVDFFEGATLVGTASAAPYTVSVPNVGAGSHSYTARATDNLGGTATSSAVTIIVDAPPAVSITSPASGASFNAPASVTLTADASDSDGTIQKVEFYYGGTNLIATVTSAPYTFPWTNVAQGTYSITAVATDDKNTATTSAAVTITVNNSSPAVILTSPTTNASFTAPATITVTATASDPDGAIQKVDFYFGGTNLITTLTAPPYTFNWTGVPQGSYAITAVATDNQAATTTSPAVNVNVNKALALAFIEVDHLNTPRRVADAAGTTLWKWDQQEPFGINVPDENPSALGIFELPLRFAGQYSDKETNLAYNMARDYDVVVGRYIQSDPIGLRGGFNTYVYVGSNPLSFTDPSGLIGAPTGSAFPGGPALPQDPTTSQSQPINVCISTQGPDFAQCRQRCRIECLPQLGKSGRSGQGMSYFRCLNDCYIRNGCM